MEKVLVLLSTYNGEKYLKQQLDSLLAQQGVDLSILVRDDGSTDGTRNILQEYQEKGPLKWYYGENLKSARSFLDLLNKAIDADYYAFCDQDDYWLEDKVVTAVEKIHNIDKPALYCSNTTLADAQLNIIKNTNKRFYLSFGESLITNPVTGCTCLINKKLKDIICKATPTKIDMHDWWIYRVCCAFNGCVYLDNTSHILYRQHANNVIGGIVDEKEKRNRHISLLKNKAKGIRYQIAVELYNCYASELPKENYELLTKCKDYKQSIIKRVQFAFDRKMTTENKITLNNFRLAVLLNKF